MSDTTPPPTNPYASPATVAEERIQPLPHVGSILRQAGQIFAGHAALLLTAALLIWMPLEFGLAFVEYGPIGDSPWFIPLAAATDIVGYTLVAPFVIMIAAQIARGRAPEIREAVVTTLLIAIPFGLTYLLWSLAMVSFLLLVIPGIYLMTRLCVVDSVAVIERKYLLQAMSRSFQLTRGSFWPLLGMVLLILLLLSVPWIVYVIVATTLPEVDNWILSGTVATLSDLVAIYPLICFYLVYRRLAREA